MKDKILQNYREGIYNELDGDSLLQMDINELILKYENRIANLEEQIENLEDGLILLRDNFSKYDWGKNES